MRKLYASEFGLLAGLLLLAQSARAEQYQSEARILNPSEAAQPAESFDAEEALEKLADNPYGQAMALRQLAAEAMEAGDSSGAVRHLKRAIGLGSLSKYASQEMQRQLALLLVNEGDYATVVTTLEPIVAEDPDPDPEVRLALAAAYAHLQRYAKAKPHIEALLKGAKNPRHDWLALAGAVEAGLKRPRDAAELYFQALELEPGQADYWLELARLRLVLKQPEAASAAYEAALRLGMLERTADRLQYVQSLLASGVPFEAASLMQAWIDEGLLVADSTVLELQARAWLGARETFLAIPALADAARATGNPDLLLQLGQLQFDQGEWEACANALEQALNKGVGKHAGPARVMRGVALYQLRRIDEARHSFRRAAESRSTRAISEQWLAYLDSGIARESAIRMAALKAAQPASSSGRYSGISGRRSSREVADSGPEFTPVGATRAGNADGSIPAWSGGLSRPDHPRGERLSDPWPTDEPQYVIDSRNADQHSEVLSRGHLALLRRYPDFRMPVFETRRSVAYPEAIYTATNANRGRAKLEGSDALVNARLGFPFPYPRSGVEIMWNHRLRFQGNASIGEAREAVVRDDGKALESRSSQQRVLYRYANIDNPADLSRENVLVYLLLLIGESSTRPDFAIIVHESANSLQKPRAIWAMGSSVGKMFRIPPLGYDRDTYGSERIATIDMFDMYNGAFDRYDWRLIGKRELIIPYNSYRMNDASRRNSALLTPRFPDPGATRYERHRVWEIEATERGGKKHKYPIRRLYVDEDSWNVVLIEHYDVNGTMLRFQEGHLIAAYDALFASSMPIIVYDMTEDRYFASRLSNDDPWLQYNASGLREADFRPAMVKSRYGR